MQTIAYTRKTAGVKVLPEVLEYAENVCLRACRMVTQEELVASGISLDGAPFWDTGLTVKRKGKLVQVWISDHNLKPI